MTAVFVFQIHANCRIRRVYFSDRLYSEDELPAEFKLYVPVQSQKAKVRNTLHCCDCKYWHVYLHSLNVWLTPVFFSCSSRSPKQKCTISSNLMHVCVVYCVCVVIFFVIFMMSVFSYLWIKVRISLLLISCLFIAADLTNNRLKCILRQSRCKH